MPLVMDGKLGLTMLGFVHSLKNLEQASKNFFEKRFDFSTPKRIGMGAFREIFLAYSSSKCFQQEVSSKTSLLLSRQNSL